MDERETSMRFPILGIVVAIALVAGIGFWFVQSGILDSATVYIRNETHADVSVGVIGANGDATHFLGGDAVLQVPGWTPGQCPAAIWQTGIGDKPGGAVLVAWGTRIAITDEYKFPAGGAYYVRIDAAGSVRVGEDVPVETQGCSVYAFHVTQ